MNYFLHDTAIVDDGAIIGPGSKIWHWTHISGGAKIGPKTSLGQNVFVGNKVSIGEGCKIQNNVSVYDNVILDDFVFCGPSLAELGAHCRRQICLLWAQLSPALGIIENRIVSYGLSSAEHGAS